MNQRQETPRVLNKKRPKAGHGRRRRLIYILAVLSSFPHRRHKSALAEQWQIEFGLLVCRSNYYRVNLLLPARHKFN